MSMKPHLVIIYLIGISLSSFSQKESGNYVEIMGNDLITNINKTNWVLAKIINGKGVFKKSRKPKPFERFNLYFKDGNVKFDYEDNSQNKDCSYFLSDPNPDIDSYMFINMSCPLNNFHCVVYRLSNEKLVIAISESTKDSYDMVYKGRFVFYKKDK
jgi:hypothetical protein